MTAVNQSASASRTVNVALNLVQDLADTSVTELFNAYGVDISRAELAMSPDHPVSLTGVIGFSGPGIRGTCVLSASEEPLRRTMPVRGAEYDWISELSNQLVGRIKNKLLAHGTVVYVTTPVVMRCQHLAPFQFDEARTLTYYAQPGNVILSIELDTSAEFALGDPVPAAEEGDLLLF